MSDAAQTARAALIKRGAEAFAEDTVAGVEAKFGKPFDPRERPSVVDVLTTALVEAVSSESTPKS